jgi:hypothetical protein
MRGLRAENERLFRRHDLDYVIVRTDASPVGPIRALFQRRARRGRR